MQCDMMSCDVMSCNMMWCDVMWCDVTSIVLLWSRFIVAAVLISDCVLVCLFCCYVSSLVMLRVVMWHDEKFFLACRSAVYHSMTSPSFLPFSSLTLPYLTLPYLTLPHLWLTFITNSFHSWTVCIFRAWGVFRLQESWSRAAWTRSFTRLHCSCWCLIKTK